MRTRVASKSTDLQMFVIGGWEIRGSVAVPVAMNAQPSSA